MGLNRYRIVLLTLFYTVLLLIGIGTNQIDWYKLAFWICLGVFYRMNRVYEKYLRYEKVEEKRAA